MHFLRTRPVLILLLLSAHPGRAQVPKMPPAHRVQHSASGAANLVRADLDGDGKPDTFCVAEAEEGSDGYFIAVMSTRGRIESKPVPACCGSVEAKKPGTLRIASKGMRGFSYYTFRWEAAAKDFRLIGYDTESFGNAAADGSGTSSLNLLTGDFIAAFNSYDARKEALAALPVVRKKVVVGKRIYLMDFGEETERSVNELAYRNFPKRVR